MPTVSKSFYEAAWEAIRRIPPGSVATYGDVAAALGRPGAARAVGTAMRLNPHPGKHTPCHRVVRSDGSVGQYMGSRGGARRKVRMLRDEGVPVDDDGRIPDLDAVRARL